MDVKDRSTPLANQVMMGHFLLHLKEALVRGKMSLSDKPQADQELQSAVYRRQIDTGECLLYFRANLLSAHVRLLGAQDIPHHRALWGESIPLILQSAGGMVGHMPANIAQ